MGFLDRILREVAADREADDADRQQRARLERRKAESKASAASWAAAFAATWPSPFIQPPEPKNDGDEKETNDDDEKNRQSHGPRRRRRRRRGHAGEASQMQTAIEESWNAALKQAIDTPSRPGGTAAPRSTPPSTPASSPRAGSALGRFWTSLSANKKGH